MRRRRHRTHQTLREESPDRAVLKQMAQLGDNLSQPHPIDFYLYFPSEAAAFVAKAQLTAWGFSVNVVEPWDTSWLCLASKIMVPREADLLAIRKKFLNLLDRLGGTYDGWETRVDL